MSIEAVTDADFAPSVLQSPTPVLVDFWAPWCTPCKAMEPVLNETAEKYAEQLKVVKINVDDNTETPAQYGVRGLPTFILFKDGVAVTHITGMVTGAELAARLAPHGVA